MRGWYRALVVFLAVSAALCTAGMAYACATLLRAESAWTGARVGDAFQWTNGQYDVSGTIEDGALLEMRVRKVVPAEPPAE